MRTATWCVAACLPLLVGCIPGLETLLTHPAEAQAVLDGRIGGLIGGLTSWAIWADPYLASLQGFFSG
jgi:hypothetical protein